MTCPLVSVIVPCYNAAPWLRETLDSALAQTGVELDIVVVDDGSRDESLAIAHKYQERGVRVIAQQNAGAAAARNHGLKLARGDYIQFLDADDLLGPGKLAAQVRILREADDQAIASGPWARFHDDPAEASFDAEPVWRDMSGIEFQIAQLSDRWMMPPVAWLCPRGIIDEAGPWDETLTLNDDGEYFCRVMLKARQIRFCSDARSFYRSGLPNSLSRRRDTVSLRSQQQSMEKIIQRLKQEDDSAPLRQAIADGWQLLGYELHPQLAEEATRCIERATEAGGSNRRVLGGRLVQWTQRLLGWRAAARVKYWTGRN